MSVQERCSKSSLPYNKRPSAKQIHTPLQSCCWHPSAAGLPARAQQLRRQHPHAWCDGVGTAAHGRRLPGQRPSVDPGTATHQAAQPVQQSRWGAFAASSRIISTQDCSGNLLSHPANTNQPIGSSSCWHQSSDLRAVMAGPQLWSCCANSPEYSPDGIKSEQIGQGNMLTRLPILNRRRSLFKRLSHGETQAP